MDEVPEAARRRAMRALSTLDLNGSTFADMVDTVVTALAESHPALGAAAEALRAWNTADQYNPRFVVHAADCGYVAIAEVVLDAAGEYETRDTSPPSYASPDQPAPYAPYPVGTKVQYILPTLSRAALPPQYGTTVQSDNWVMPSTHALIEPEDSPGNYVLVPIVDMVPDQRQQPQTVMDDDSYDQIRRTLIRASTFCRRGVKDDAFAALADAVFAECQAAIRTLAMSTGRPLTCRAVGCVRKLPTDSVDTLCTAHKRDYR